MKILLIDDDESLLAALRDVLADAGHEVVATADGGAALEELGNMSPELVVMDLFMPEVDGFELVRQIRKRFDGVRMLAISGSPMNEIGPDYLEMAKRLGADAIMRKPFRAGELVAAVEKLAPRRSPAESGQS